MLVAMMMVVFVYRMIVSVLVAVMMVVFVCRTIALRDTCLIFSIQGRLIKGLCSCWQWRREGVSW